MDTEHRIELDAEDIEQARKLGESIKGQMSNRNVLFDALENIYKMEWKLPDDARLKEADVKKTVSPEGRNAIQGSVRLLTTTDPVWKITVEGEDNAKGNSLEDAAQLIWNRSGTNRNKPPHHDMLLSMLLYDEVHVAVSSIHEFAKLLKDKPNKMERAKMAARKAPFTIDVWNPKEGYPYFDSLGLAGYYRSVTMTKDNAREVYGSIVGDILDSEQRSKDTNVQLDIWYDLDKYVVWLNGKVIRAEKWELPFLPISVTIGEGSSLFQETDESRNPMLLTIYKSGLWEHLNLCLTVMYTNVRRYGLNPLYMHKKGPASTGDEARFDYGRGVIEVPYGDDFTGVKDKQAIDPSLIDAMTNAARMFEESTIYKTALGQSLGASAPFSSISLLTQSGRIPLAVPKKMGAMAISSVMEICLRWYKHLNEYSPGIKLKPAEVPEYFEVAVTLEIDLPQDKLQQANIASMLIRDGIVDMDWTRENVLQITNGPEMEERIWSEKASRAMFEQMMQQMLQPQAPGNPQMGGPQQTMSPEQMAAMMQRARMTQGTAHAMQGVPSGMPEGMQGMEQQSAQPMPPLNGNGIRGQQ